ncbi:hypothetical protein LPW11_14140 [Geomonas sp. RF6]|uniref:hypothetical protein n=1 Tax=Geomonas sp. RF6 TaxID=2897342 RepID=UPI001E632778|nr:hypothetical protein [Geomonas sp. RF6]UFS69032.1 hypothetical protein LPW11_14140 [Geomonas sp. RF6]
MKEGNDSYLEDLRTAWVNGGNPRPLIEELLRLKRMEEAGALARLALDAADCPDRAAIEKLLEQTGAPPPGWADAVVDFSRNPTAEKWDALMYFTPQEVLYERTRNTLRMLRRLGTDANTLFRCATRDATFPEAFELVESGEVDPETVLERAAKAPPQTKGLWLGLAAEAAFARGDELGTVRFLKMACDHAVKGVGPEMSVKAIRSRAGSSLNEMLDRIGVPRHASGRSS